MDKIKHLKVLKDENLSKHTSFRIGGKADYVLLPKYKEALCEALFYLRDNDIPYMILGNGSNVLATDNGYKGAVIKLTKMTGIHQTDNTLYVRAGTLLSAVGTYCLEHGLSGFEQLAGIPGTVGGAIVMNAGAYGAEISDILVSSEYIDQNFNYRILDKEYHEFSYRHSFYIEYPNYIITRAAFELKEAPKEQIKASMDDYKKQRSAKQPLNLPSAGSTFKRPEGYFAAKLIEDAGLKGYSVGGAKVSEKHSGFVVNYNQATCNDVLQLIEDVQKKVYQKDGIMLECEIRIIGD